MIVRKCCPHDPKHIIHCNGLPDPFILLFPLSWVHLTLTLLHLWRPKTGPSARALPHPSHHHGRYGLPRAAPAVVSATCFFSTSSRRQSGADLRTARFRVRSSLVPPAPLDVFPRRRRGRRKPRRRRQHQERQRDDWRQQQGKKILQKKFALSLAVVEPTLPRNMSVEEILFELLLKREPNFFFVLISVFAGLKDSIYGSHLFFWYFFDLFFQVFLVLPIVAFA